MHKRMCNLCRVYGNAEQAKSILVPAANEAFTTEAEAKLVHYFSHKFLE